jgi:hypothetical protein
VLILLALTIGIVTPSFAQQIRAEVKLLLERLPLEKQQKLKNLAEDIEVYINDHDWTGEIWDKEIPVSIQIFLQDNSVNYESRYAGTFLITNNLDIQYYDKYWRFPYQYEERLLHQDGIYHPFMGFIDFYVYLILGGEYDKQGRFLGTPYYEKANYISEQAKFVNQFIRGWEERTLLVNRILSDSYKPFREMKDLFFLGLSYVGEEDSTARKYCTQSLSIFEKILRDDPYDEEAIRFIKVHHIEYIDIFKEDRDMLEMLMRVDKERAETYQKYLDQQL